MTDRLNVGDQMEVFSRGEDLTTWSFLFRVLY